MSADIGYTNSTEIWKTGVRECNSFALTALGKETPCKRLGNPQTGIIGERSSITNAATIA
jgi:hypothetical protein